MTPDIMVILPHCLLNQATRAGRARTPHVESEVSRILAREAVGVEQLPCPEYLFQGSRSPRDQDEWERIPGFVEFCRNQAAGVRLYLEGIMALYSAVVILGVARSPCCGWSKVYRAGSLVDGAGLFLGPLCQDWGLPVTEFDFKAPASSLRAVQRRLRAVRSGPKER